ncbi:hypothetical protein [Agromyces laixinhei]|uniref:hypothetical protein n=1 Tax=Agromyces laixinhei TaxID=2585717 RepID=UPI0012ECBE5D|nr:hypothetical protein [Agromyces laixinhei]
MHALTATVRTWPMLAALGAALVLIALAAGAGGVMQPALLVLGVAALGWGGLALHTGRVLAPATVLVVAAASLVGTAAAVATGSAATADVAPGPLAAASVFIVVVAFSAGLVLRGRDRGRGAARETRGDRATSDTARLIGLVAGAALVAALATPALAATEAGESAVPHGTHQQAPDSPSRESDRPGGHAH